MTLALRYAVRSDVGLLREGNEDAAYAGPHLLAVADGMGGYEAGEVASAAVISSVAPLDRAAMPESELIDALAAAVTTAKQALRRIVDSDPSVGSMGTTLTAMLWAGGSAAICHIGDSRAYLVRDGDLYQITHDHTYVQALIDQGRIRPEEASTHPQRSLLLRALDGRTDADPDLSMLDARIGDRYLICSDGLPVAVSDDDILRALVEQAEPGDAVVALIDLAIRGGAPDNVTCIVADVIDPERDGMVPTSAPVVVGASVNGSNHDTKPFSRPASDSAIGMTTLGTIPAAHATQTMRAHGTAQHSALRAAPSQRVPASTIRAGRHAAGPMADEGEVGSLRRGRRRWPLMTSILALFVLLVGAGLFIGNQYVHNQYYVGLRHGKIVLFRGLDQQLLGISLSSPYRYTGIPVVGIPAQDVQAIHQNSAGSLTQATQLITNIRKDYTTCQNARAAVRLWQAHKPGPVKKRVRIHGRIVTRMVTPHYRPRPTIPADCPPQPSSGQTSG
jgi:PPM family protein phosphatase